MSQKPKTSFSLAPPIKIAFGMVFIGLLFAAYAKLNPPQPTFSYDKAAFLSGQNNILRDFSFDVSIPKDIAKGYQIDFITDIYYKGKSTRGSFHSLYAYLNGSELREVRTRLSLYTSSGLGDLLLLKVAHGPKGVQSTTQPFRLSRKDVAKTNFAQSFQPYPSGPLSLTKPNILGMYRVYYNGEDSKKRYYEDELIQVLVSVTFTPVGKTVKRVSGPPPFVMMPKPKY